jgi:hypothetical protein
MKARFFLPLLILLCFSPAVFAQKIIKTAGPTEGSSNFAYDLLAEIVKTKGEYQIEHVGNETTRVSVDKTVADFENGIIDVMWTLSDASWEEKYLAVPYPAYLGMFGLRLPIVKQEQAGMLSGVRSLQDLQKFRAGQGRAWADSTIMEANGIPVVRVVKYISHFPMLEGGRFDYFPRAIHEPWSEVRNNAQYNLAVDENIVLRYRVPFFIFVMPQNQELHQYLTEGMEELSRSGRHREMFFKLPEVREALEYSNLQNRVVIDLDNPNIGPDTPVDQPELWFDPLRDEIPEFD